MTDVGGELPDGWHVETAAPEQIEDEREVWGAFTASLRRLVDVTIRSEVDLDVVRAAHAQLEGLNTALGERTIEGSYGVRTSTTEGELFGRAWGNAIMGLRNALAPPLDIHRDPAGRAWCDFELGAAYEGPAGLVHGGVTALVLDHVCGAAAGADGRPRMTGTLTMRYVRGTRLGVPLRAEAHIDRSEGRKFFVVGSVADVEGSTVEADGVFILPRWAADL